PDYIWAPGCWIWLEGRYAWRPGYWVAAHPDWIWVPSHYIYSPRGYVYCEGYWDYTVESRGVLFAPVVFEAGVFVRPSFRFSPFVAINLSLFADHLFVRPSCHHYYFGDYYAPRYYNEGIYASFSFTAGRHGYDPIYVNERYRHRDDADWDRHIRQTFLSRREHEDERPPRTFAAQVARSTTRTKSGDRSLTVAVPFDQVVKSKDHALRFRPVAKEETQGFVKRGQDLETFRGERRRLEASASGIPAGKPPTKPDADRPDSKPEVHPVPAEKPGKPDAKPDTKPDVKPDARPEIKPEGIPARADKPDKANRLKSPIAAKPAEQFEKGKAPPRNPEPPKPDPKVEPRPRQGERGRPDPPQFVPKDKDDSSDKPRGRGRGKGGG